MTKNKKEKKRLKYQNIQNILNPSQSETDNSCSKVLIIIDNE